MNDSVGSAAQMSRIISKYLDPPDECIIRVVFESIERAADGIYNLHKLAKILPQTLDILQLLDILLSTKREFYDQCENIAKLLKDISVHSVSYVDFASLLTSVARNQDAEVKHFNILLQDTNQGVMHIQQIMHTFRTQGLKALKEMQDCLSDQASTSRPDHYQHPSTSLRSLQTLRIYVQSMKPDVFLELATQTKKKARASHRRDLVLLVKGISEEMAHGLASLLKLQEYYSTQFPNHLRSLILDMTRTSHVVDTESVGWGNLDDLVRVKETWARFDHIITEGVSRLWRAADAIGVIKIFDGTKTSLTSTQASTSHLQHIPPPLPPRPPPSRGSSLSQMANRSAVAAISSLGSVVGVSTLTSMNEIISPYPQTRNNTFYK